MIDIKYIKKCEPQRDAGNSFLLFCYKDTLLKKWEITEIETWVVSHWWPIRVEPLMSTFVKHWFTINRTVFVSWRKQFAKLTVRWESVIQQDVEVKEWMAIALITPLVWPSKLEEILEDLYNKYSI